jgi:hypothetical protein
MNTPVMDDRPGAGFTALQCLEAGEGEGIVVVVAVGPGDSSDTWGGTRISPGGEEGLNDQSPGTFEGAGERKQELAVLA